MYIVLKFLEEGHSVHCTKVLRGGHSVYIVLKF